MHCVFVFLLVTLLLVKNTLLLVTCKRALSIKHFLDIECALRWLQHADRNRWAIVRWSTNTCYDVSVPRPFEYWAGVIMGEKIFTICPAHDPLTQDVYFLAGEWSNDVFLENVSFHFVSCLPVYTLTTHPSPFLPFRFPVSSPLSFLFLSSASTLS